MVYVQYEPNNWQKQRRRVAEVHASMSNKKRDYKHKLAHFYTTEYDAVFVEELATNTAHTTSRSIHAGRPKSVPRVVW